MQKETTSKGMEANKNFGKWLSCGIQISGTFGLHNVCYVLFPFLGIDILGFFLCLKINGARKKSNNFFSGNAPKLYWKCYTNWM
jgi:hypothetical protein